MLFQGEEWAASTPFQYFADHDDPEMAQAGFRGAKQGICGVRMDEPMTFPTRRTRATFQRSKLNWEERGDRPHAEMLDWYRALIALRRVTPALNDGDSEAEVRSSEEERWLVMDRGRVQVLANLGRQEASFEVPEGFRVALVSREIARIDAGRIVLPANTLAVLSSEPE